MQVVDVHKKSLNEQGYTSLEAWLVADNKHVYVGRQNAWVAGAKRSKWANPFSVKKYGLIESLRLYRIHVANGELLTNIKELEGMKLGCWCVNDDCLSLSTDVVQCHAQVLVLLLRETSSQS